MLQLRAVTRWLKAFLKAGLKAAALVLAAVLAFTLVLSVIGTVRTGVHRPAGPPTVNDITQLNPVAVERVATPTSTEEVVAAVRGHDGPIAIGGGRFSQGGQTATDGALQLDLRQMNRILDFSPGARTITVQPGVRWRDIQDRIDSAGLAVRIMQTYANFTVGGSLSVNAHGRYVGQGPLILSVRKIELVLADGSVVVASPTRNADVFYGAIGGYGGLGVITRATLDLADNTRLRRMDETMPVATYREWFFRTIRDSASVVFHNGDLYPDAYQTVHAVSFVGTDDSVTVPMRLIPRDRSYRVNRFAYWVISEWPFGNAIRRRIIDPLVYRGSPVVWRNYEASYDVAELEPRSRDRSTYVLQEYFVPVERFDEFVPRMGAVLRRHDVNAVNVSIRHAKADPGSLLAWARSEVFAFVLYYKQETHVRERERVASWTRELIDSVLGVGGAYYLPYQPHATEEQFLRAYPRAPEFFALKRRLDPHNKFRNRLWDRYYLPPGSHRPELSDAARARLAADTVYARDEGQTFLTHPEWYIVYSSDEYAAWLRDRHPTSFPYLRAIGQYWTTYLEARRLTGKDYPFNWPYHVMLWVIGTSYSAELALKGAYENTLGRLSGAIAGWRLSDEDHFAHVVADDYGRFIHVRPWYEYPFGSRLAELWTSVPPWGRDPVRKWERRFFLTAEFGVKAVYANLIEFATRSAYGTAADRVRMVVRGWNDGVAAADTVLEPVGRPDSAHTLVAAPRYDAFRDAMRGLARDPRGVEIVEIAGNDEIFLTGTAPTGWKWAGRQGSVPYTLPLPTDSTRIRVTMRLPVSRLLPTLAELDRAGQLQVDHVYDY
ncbi:MAG: FAD-binding oxidoreductase [Gemmatimonadales bacterium]